MRTGRQSMKNTIAFGITACTICVGVLAAADEGQQKAGSGDATAATSQQTDPANDARIGKRVIVTEAGAPLRTPDAIVWKAYLGETFTVSLTNSEWLWIAEKGGWLWEKQTVMFDAAIPELTERLKKEPTAENYHLRGIAYSAHQQYDKAIADYTQSLKLTPNTAGVLNNRGQAQYFQNNYDAAIRDFDAAISADPKHFVAMNNRALCYIARQDYPAALRDLNAALKLNQEYPEALNNRGVVHSALNNFKAAIKDYSAALKIDDKYIDAYGNRAYAYRQQNQLTEAVADLRTAMEKAPLDFKPVNDLAWMLATVADESVQNPEEAIKLATSACQMTQYANWNTLDTLAAAYAAAGDFESAQQWIATAIEKAGDAEKPGLQKHLEQIQAGQRIVK
ncbi:MAG: tetratricopeptide repeat protein [Fuerstiella sp.]